MKRIIAVNLAEGSLRLRRFLVAGRTFALLTFATMIIFVLAGAATIVRNQSDSSPASTMKGLASAVSSAFFADMLGMEMPAFQSTGSSGSFSGRQVGSFVLRMLTDVNPSSPRSLLAASMPAMSDDGAALLKGGNAAGGETPQDDYPVNPVGEGQNGHEQAGR